ncbi:hypothetical protein, partial [Comamonas sp.]|uniref:hypothetical protein n=1 Tax=Comamonas sp. TaxID=34028 RepID=UPI002FC72550
LDGFRELIGSALSDAVFQAAAPAQAQEDACDVELFRGLHWATTLMEDPAGEAYQAAMIAEAEKVHEELGGKMENNTIDQYRRILKAGLNAARAAQGGAA